MLTPLFQKTRATIRSFLVRISAAAGCTHSSEGAMVWHQHLRDGYSPSHPNPS
nr:hypothetical protein [Porphyromonas gulae]